MNSNVTYITLAAARLSASEVFDAAVREGLEAGMKQIGIQATISALSNFNVVQGKEIAKAA